jgi:ATP-grasp domain
MVVAASRAISNLPESARSLAWLRRARAMDKAFVATRLAEAGLFAPPTVVEPLWEDGQPGGDLHLPILRKPRTGSSGDGMSILRSFEELEALMAMGPASDEYFFEQFVEGRQLQFGGVFADDGDGVVVVYETVQRQGAFGPSSEIRMIDDPALERAGREAVVALGITGMMNINVIRDADGRDWIHDVNPRVFGTFMAFRGAGVDILQAYVDWIRRSSQVASSAPTPIGSPRGRQAPVASPRAAGRKMEESPSTSRVVDGASLLSFPGAFRANADDDHRAYGLFPFLRTAASYRRWIGPRYAFYETVCQLLIEAGRAKKSLLGHLRS